MIPKEAIEKGIEGGWETYASYWQTIDWQVIALDPSFWQALGKALGWLAKYLQTECPKCHHDVKYLNPGNFCPECGSVTVSVEHWRQYTRSTFTDYAHRFYDLILTGGDTEAFWNELLTK